VQTPLWSPPGSLQAWLTAYPSCYCSLSGFPPLVSKALKEMWYLSPFCLPRLWPGPWSEQKERAGAPHEWFQQRYFHSISHHNRCSKIAGTLSPLESMTTHTSSGTVHRGSCVQGSQALCAHGTFLCGASRVSWEPTEAIPAVISTAPPPWLGMRAREQWAARAIGRCRTQYHSAPTLEPCSNQAWGPDAFNNLLRVNHFLEGNLDPQRNGHLSLTCAWTELKATGEQSRNSSLSPTTDERIWRPRDLRLEF
jgi:hypothetical protein